MYVTFKPCLLGLSWIVCAVHSISVQHKHLLPQTITSLNAHNPHPRFAEACRIQSFLIFALNPSRCIQLLLPVPACRVCSTWGHTTGNEIQFSVQCCFAASLSCYIPHPLRRKGARTNRRPCMIWCWPRRAKWNYSDAVQTISGPPFYYIPTSFIVCSPLLVKTCSWASVFKPRIV